MGLNSCNDIVLLWIDTGLLLSLDLGYKICPFRHDFLPI